jgi:DNA-directed RNA polymerase
MEIAKANRSSCPEKYVCHFPVHQDGSCNGLQHYAALGRDEAGAVSVNLAPATIPQDVYSCVAALVSSLIMNIIIIMFYLAKTDKYYIINCVMPLKAIAKIY